jgi:hypothetical protein
MMRITRLVACVGLFWLTVATGASADPVTVTGGFLTAPPYGAPSGVASLIGTRGFSLEARVNTIEGSVHPLNECSPCLPGTAFSVGAILSTTVFEGVATLDGRTYSDLSGFLPTSASLYFEFFGRTVAPAFQDAPTIITAPFRVQGTFGVPFPPGFGPELRGGGIASVLLRPQPLTPDPPGWFVGGVRYDFADQKPIPEPATLAMVAGGLLAVARGAKRARRRSVRD